MRPVVVHLLGFPAVGKFTVAKQVAATWPTERGRMIVVDNHHINNVIFAVLDVDGVKPLPPRVWDLTRDVKSSVLTAIEELAPRDWSYVFTSFRVADNPRHEASLQRIADVAERRDSTFVPVRLHCASDEIARRASTPDRRAGMKWTDVEAVQAVSSNYRLVDMPYPEVLDLDVTNATPAQAAETILRHIDALADR